MAATSIVDTLSGLHYFDVDEPDEDFMLLQHAFCDLGPSSSPTTYPCMADGFRRPAHATPMRITGVSCSTSIGRRRAAGRHSNSGIWLLKMPFHLMELEVLLETYPDAVFIQTHSRDPTQFMASWNSLVERLRSFTSVPRPTARDRYRTTGVHEWHGSTRRCSFGLRVPLSTSAGPTCAMSILSMTRWPSSTTSAIAFGLASGAGLLRHNAGVAHAASGTTPARTAARVQAGGLRPYA